RTFVRGGNPVTAGSSPLGAGVPGMQRPGTAVPPTGPVGTLRITNRNFFDTEVIVNGVAHFVAPNSTQDISVSAGQFTYAVPPSMAGSRSRVMPAGQVFAITINP